MKGQSIKIELYNFIMQIIIVHMLLKKHTYCLYLQSVVKHIFVTRQQQNKNRP